MAAVGPATPAHLPTGGSTPPTRPPTPFPSALRSGSHQQRPRRGSASRPANTNQDDWVRAPPPRTRKDIGTRGGEWGSGLPSDPGAGSPLACPRLCCGARVGGAGARVPGPGTASGRREPPLRGGRRGGGPAAERATATAGRQPPRAVPPARASVGGTVLCRTVSWTSPAAVTDAVPAAACPLGRRGGAHLERRSVDAQRIQSAKAC